MNYLKMRFQEAVALKALSPKAVGEVGQGAEVLSMGSEKAFKAL